MKPMVLAAEAVEVGSELHGGLLGAEEHWGLAKHANVGELRLTLGIGFGVRALIRVRVEAPFESFSAPWLEEAVVLRLAGVQYFTIRMTASSAPRTGLAM